MGLWDHQSYENQLGSSTSQVDTRSHSSLTQRSRYRRLPSLSRDFCDLFSLCTAFVVLHRDTNPCEKDPCREGSTSCNGDPNNKGNSCFRFSSLLNNIYEVPQSGRKPWPLSPLKRLWCFKDPQGRYTPGISSKSECYACTEVHSQRKPDCPFAQPANMLDLLH